MSGFRNDVIATLESGYTCTGPIECAEKVRKSSRAGADVISVDLSVEILADEIADYAE